MIEVTIGGEAHQIPPLSISKIRAVAPKIDHWRITASKVNADAGFSAFGDYLGATLAVYGELIDGMTVEDLEGVATADEAKSLWEKIPDIMKEAGLMAKGERQGVQTIPDPSTKSSTKRSPKSSAG